MRVALLLAVAVLAAAVSGGRAGAAQLPDLGPAPRFTLVSQRGAEVSLDQLAGKVVVVAFIYTWCPDICPMLTDKMARVQDALGEAFGRDVAFVSITFDPERDTPEVLRDYAKSFGADPADWHFLTGDPENVREVTRSYGVLTFPGVGGSIDHNLLTTLIDRKGRIRVQYAGYRFDPAKLETDLRALMRTSRHEGMEPGRQGGCAVPGAVAGQTPVCLSRDRRDACRARRRRPRHP